MPRIHTPCSHVGKTRGEDSVKKSEGLGNGNGSREETHGRGGQAGWCSLCNVNLPSETSA